MVLVLRAGTFNAALRICYGLAPSFDRGGTGDTDLKGGNSGIDEIEDFGIAICGLVSMYLRSISNARGGGVFQGTPDFSSPFIRTCYAVVVHVTAWPAPRALACAVKKLGSLGTRLRL